MSVLCAAYNDVERRFLAKVLAWTSVKKTLTCVSVSVYVSERTCADTKYCVTWSVRSPQAQCEERLVGTHPILGASLREILESKTMYTAV